MVTMYRLEATIKILTFLVLISHAVAQQNNNGADIHRGWEAAPSTRGTIDILWSCIFTAFLCSWSAIHLDVPTKRSGRWKKVPHRLKWMLIALLAPEFITLNALIDFMNASSTAKKINELEITTNKWTLTHGFFVNMRGFTTKKNMQTDIWGRQEDIPLAKVHFLSGLREGEFDLPEITEAEIQDKGKSDTLGKLITCVQGAWLVAQIIGRAAQRLPITTLEITTSGWVLCMLLSYIFWWKKPLGVLVPVTLQLREDPPADARSSMMMTDDGEERERPSPARHPDFSNWSPWQVGHYVNTEWDVMMNEVLDSPVHALMAHYTFGLPIKSCAFFIMVCLAVGGVHFAAWKFSFPTAAERWMWQIASISTAVLPFIPTVVAGIVMYTYATFVGDFDDDRYGRFKRWNKVLAWILLSMYFTARLYLLIEAFVGLRQVPTGVYEQVQWASFIPHV
jgi:hypothetical protein